MELDRRKLLAVAGIIAALLGLLVLPFLVQRLYGFSAVKVTFAVIVVYAAVSLYMNRDTG